MSIKYRLSLYWKLILLGYIAGCALLEKWLFYQEPSVPKGVPNSAPDVQNENEDFQIVPTSVLVPRDFNADDPSNGEGVTPTTASTITQPPSATNPSCQNIGQCYAYASSVTIYHWPSKALNTSCPAKLPDLPNPPGLNPISPSIYAVFVSLTRSDGCNGVRSSDRFTASFAPDEVSTITDSSGKVAANDFGNAPCGPPGWISNGQPYQPWFNAPQALFEQFGGLDGLYCIMPEIQDPPIALISMPGPINGPILPPKAKFRRHRGAETEARTGTTVGAQSVYQGPTNRRHLPRYMTAAATAHGVPPSPARTPNP